MTLDCATPSESDFFFDRSRGFIRFTHCTPG